MIRVEIPASQLAFCRSDDDAEMLVDEHLRAAGIPIRGTRGLLRSWFDEEKDAHVYEWEENVDE